MDGSLLESRGWCCDCLIRFVDLVGREGGRTASGVSDILTVVEK